MNRTPLEREASRHEAAFPNERSAAVLAGYYLLEGLNSCAACYYFYYLFFYLQKHFGFGNTGNLTVCAINGFIYIFSAWFGGKFAQARGYFTALLFGFGIMIAALLIGSRVESISAEPGNTVRLTLKRA